MVYTALKEQVQSLLDLLTGINPSVYTFKSPMLGQGSIGQHVRHVVEMMQCLCAGYNSGIINYDHRKRDSRIETDTFFTSAILQELLSGLQQPDKGLTLQQEETSDAVVSTFKRELLYNTEHAIHHMALIKVALREMQLDITGENFGLAPATIRYKAKALCAQ